MRWVHVLWANAALALMICTFYWAVRKLSSLQSLSFAQLVPIAFAVGFLCGAAMCGVMVAYAWAAGRPVLPSTELFLASSIICGTGAIVYARELRNKPRTGRRGRA